MWAGVLVHAVIKFGISSPAGRLPASQEGFCFTKFVINTIVCYDFSPVQLQPSVGKHCTAVSEYSSDRSIKFGTYRFGFFRCCPDNLMEKGWKALNRATHVRVVRMGASERREANHASSPPPGCFRTVVSTFFVRVPPDIISLQLCTPKLLLYNSSY
jgi:hypothetical protein